MIYRIRGAIYAPQETKNSAFEKEVHRRAFAPDYQAAGRCFDEHGDCVLEEFEVVYR